MVPARFVVSVFVAPLVFRAPEGPAAREARRPHFVRRRASKPARALRSLRRPPHRRCLWLRCARAPTPPTGAAARPRLAACPCPLSLRRPPHRRRRIADVCSARRLVVRPGPATAHGCRSQVLPRSPAMPSGPSGALHAGGACGSGVPGPRSLWVLRRVPVKEISPQLGALVRGTALH